MYIIFLGIVPSILLILFLFYYSRHNVLPFWKRPRKSYVDLLPCTKRHDATNDSKHSKLEDKSHKSFLNNIPNFHYNAYKLRNFLSFHSKTPKNINKNNATESHYETHIYDVPEFNDKEMQSKIQINFDYGKPLPKASKNPKFDRKITKADIVINKHCNVDAKDENEESHYQNADEIKTNKNNAQGKALIENSNLINNTLSKVEISSPINDAMEKPIVKSNELNILIANAKNNLNKSPKPNNKNNDKLVVKVNNEPHLNTVLTNAKNKLSKSPKPTVKNVSNAVTVVKNGDEIKNVITNKELNSVVLNTNNNLPKPVNTNDVIKTSITIKEKPKVDNKPNISKVKPNINKAKPSIEKKELASTTNKMIAKGSVANKTRMFNTNDKNNGSNKD